MYDNIVRFMVNWHFFVLTNLDDNVRVCVFNIDSECIDLSNI